MTSWFRRASPPTSGRGGDVENHVRVIASGDTGWLFVNGGYEAELDLSGLVESGSVSLTGAWFRGHEHPGSSSRYADFTVRTLRRVYGPRGRLHRPRP